MNILKNFMVKVQNPQTKLIANMSQVIVMTKLKNNIGKLNRRMETLQNYQKTLKKQLKTAK
jgi:chaperonin cofactor prefoldin